MVCCMDGLGMACGSITADGKTSPVLATDSLRGRVARLAAHVIPRRSFAKAEEQFSLPQGMQLLKLSPGFCSGPWAANLRKLDLTSSGLGTLPAEIGNMVTLQELKVGKNKLRELPVQVGDLSQLQVLDAAENLIVAVGGWVGKLKEMNLLNLMGNQMKDVPEEIGQLEKLHTLGLRTNQLQSLPDSLGDLHSLVNLFLTENQLSTLPRTFGKLTSLRKLQASHNPFVKLPDEMAQCKNLELCRVACGKLQEVPSCFTGPGACPALSWPALAGNPCVLSKPPGRLTLPDIEESEVKITNAINRDHGASGDVKWGTWNGQTVVLKIFKDVISPDGSPEGELVASIVAGAHPNIVVALAAVRNQGKLRGILLQPAQGKPLGGVHKVLPVDRVHRASYPWATEKPPRLSWIVSVFSGLAAGMAYLHERNVATGDVFAHNVLVTEDGHGTMCDYGAAFVYPPSCRSEFESMEVRALGILLQDMCDLVDTADAQDKVLFDSGVHRDLRNLAKQCCQEERHKRPTFLQMSRALGWIMNDAKKSTGRT